MKFTVSELKKERRCKKKRERKCIKNHRRFLFFPFIKEEETLSGASRGSAYHKF